MALGPLGRAYENSLREGKPELYRQLQASGTLEDHLADMDTAAQLEFESTFSALQKQQVAPDSFLERVQHFTALASQARELVLNDLLVRDESADAVVDR